jgi:signal peptidase I
VFVLGDNRDESYDSRFWGAVPIADVRGRVGLIYWSWGDGWQVGWDRIGRRVE